jgi:endonuclease/exonuclease/phosphatase family metal-dependent hydrolase
VPYDLAVALDRLEEPDVLVVQEVRRPDEGPMVVADWAAARGYDRHEVIFSRATLGGRWPHADPQGEGTVGMAVLSRLPGRLVAELAVGAESLDRNPGRRVLHTELVVGQATVTVVGVHLSSRLPFAPPIQLRTLARRVRPVTGPAVVAGDCNFWGPPAAWLLPGWRRAVRGRTWPAHRPHSQIDHVFLRGGVDLVHGRILDDVGSDHRPVSARLRVT